MIELRDANPVPPDRIDGWFRSAEGRATRARVDSSGSVGPQRRPRPVRTVAVAATVVLALVVSVLVIRSGSDTSTPAASHSVVDRLARGRWKELDPGPAADLDPVVSTVWTGRELLVWGSSRTSSKAEGFAFEPRRARWRPIAEPIVVANPGVWTGREFLVWSGLSIVADCPCIGAAYDPATDAWRPMAAAPFGPSPGSTATWAGRELIVTNGDSERCLSVSASSCVPDVASYDPETDTWKTLPDPPVSLRGNESVRAVWIGRDVVYVVPSGVIADRAALLFDPERHIWVRFSPPFETGSFGTVGLVRAGDTAAALEWNATAPHVDAELRWSRLQVPPAPWVPGPRALRHRSICSIEASPVPRGAVVFCEGYHLVGLDLTSGAWRRFPAAPDLLPRSVVWTGHELVAFTDQQLLALEPAAK